MESRLPAGIDTEIILHSSFSVLYLTQNLSWRRYHVKKEIDYFLNTYYSRYTGLYLKSKDFITKLKDSISEK